jgi:hypothetical protein
MGNSGSASSDPKVQSLIDMGFTKDNAKAALERASGDVEQAAMMLLSAGGGVPVPVPARQQPQAVVENRSRQYPLGQGGGGGAALARQQAQQREDQELADALAASAAMSGGGAAQSPYPQAGVVTGIAVPAPPAAGGGVNAFNDAQLAAALAASATDSGRPSQPPPAAPISTAPFGSRGGAVPGVAIPAPSPTPSTAAAHSSRTMSYEEQMKMVMAESRKTALYDFERRAESLKVPSEPEDGAAGSSWLFFRIGDATVKRRFWSDNSITNVSHYVQCHTAVFEEFGADPIQLVNMTTYPPEILDLERDGPRTLQACELWPSGRIAIQAKGDELMSTRHFLLPPTTPIRDAS